MKEFEMPRWIGPWEIAIVVVIALLIFGPRKLPELGSSFGKSIRGFRQGLKEGQEELSKAMADVKEAGAESPVAQTTTAEAVSSTAAAEATTAEATTATTTATATADAPVTDTKPRCWGTYEKDDASCLQCTISDDCSRAGAEAPTVG
jgi:sec-independent protein translocase protein TatA